MSATPANVPTTPVNVVDPVFLIVTVQITVLWPYDTEPLDTKAASPDAAYAGAATAMVTAGAVQAAVRRTVRRVGVRRGCVLKEGSFGVEWAWQVVPSAPSTPPNLGMFGACAWLVHGRFRPVHAACISGLVQ